MNPVDYLQYGAMGLLALILVGGGYGAFKLGTVLVERLALALDAHVGALKDVHTSMNAHHTVVVEKLTQISAGQESHEEAVKELRREVRTALHTNEISGDLAPIRGAKG